MNHDQYFMILIFLLILKQKTPQEEMMKNFVGFWIIWSLAQQSWMWINIYFFGKVNDQDTLMTKLSYITTNQQNICIDFITPRIELGDLWNLLTTSRKHNFLVHKTFKTYLLIYVIEMIMMRFLVMLLTYFEQFQIEKG